MTHTTRFLFAMLVVFLLPSCSFGQCDWSGACATQAWLKVEPRWEPGQKYLEAYIEHNSPEIWKHCEYNEFRRRRERQAMQKVINEKLDELDLDAIYVHRTGVEFGKYDFEHNAFPNYQGKSNHNWQVARDKVWNPVGHAPSMRFSNSDALEWIKVAPDDAEKFIEGHKDDRGRTKRTLKVDITFRIIGKFSKFSSQWLVAEVVGATYYRDDERKTVLYHFGDMKAKPKPGLTAEDVLKEVEGAGISSRKSGEDGGNE